MENKQTNVTKREKGRPVSDNEVAEIMSEFGKYTTKTEVLSMAKRDILYGLPKEDVKMYVSLHGFGMERLEALSRALKIKDGKPLAEYMAGNSFNIHQMNLLIEFYQKGISLEQIKEVMVQEQTAYSLSQALQKVYEALYQARESAACENSDVKEMQERIEEVVSQVGANKEFLNQVLARLEEMGNGLDVDALSQGYIEKLEEKDAIIRSQQEENNKLASDNAVLRNRQQKESDREKLNEAMAELEREKAGLLERLDQAEKERKEVAARLDEAGKEREAMERKMEGMEREMSAVK